MTDSRAKGLQFERDCCQLLGSWLSEITGEDVTLRRILDQTRTVDLGDIEWGPLLFECKRYKQGNWHRPEWWEQVCRASKRRVPILIYKFDRQPIRFVFPLWAVGDFPKIDHHTVTVTPEHARLIIKRLIDDPFFNAKRLQDSSEAA